MFPLCNSINGLCFSLQIMACFSVVCLHWLFRVGSVNSVFFNLVEQYKILMAILGRLAKQKNLFRFQHGVRKTKILLWILRKPVSLVDILFSFQYGLCKTNSHSDTKIVCMLA